MFMTFKKEKKNKKWENGEMKNKKKEKNIKEPETVK